VTDDGALLEGLRRGDGRAWRDFLDRYERLIYSVPRRYGLPPEAAADVFQDTLMALLRGLSRLRDPRALPRWLTRTAYRLSRDQQRKDRRAGRPQAEEFWAAIADSRPGIEEEMVRLEAAGRVMAALPQLSSRCQSLLSALFLEDSSPSYGELARRLGSPIGSLGPTRRRCLEALLQLLADSETAPSRIKGAPAATFDSRRPMRRPRTRSVS
jgi:RNA polymerase sigma factor (sigma-70 family)